MPEESPSSKPTRISRRHFSSEVQPHAMRVMAEYGTIALKALSLSHELSTTDERQAEVIKKISNVSFGISAFLISRVPKSITKTGVEAAPASQPELKDIEREVLQLVAKGLTQYEVADKLNISIGAVSSRMVNIRKRYGIDDLLGLIEHFAGTGEIDFSEEDKEAVQKRLKSYPTIGRSRPKDTRAKGANKKRGQGEMLEDPVLIVTREQKKNIERRFRSDIFRTLSWLQKKVHRLTDDPQLQDLENIESIGMDNPELLEVLLERGLITPKERDAKNISRHAYIAAIIIKAGQRSPEQYQGLFLSKNTLEKSMKIIADEEKKLIKDSKGEKKIQY